VLLTARGLTYARPDAGDAPPVLAGVDLDVASGEVVEIGGPSGAGKSTLVLALARLLHGATGSLALDGVDGATMAPERWRAAVSLLPQKPTLPAGTVAAAVAAPWALKVRHGLTQPDPAAVRAALDGVGLAEIELDRDVARLSVGQVARVAFVRLALTGPRVILLDEPDAALDDPSAELVGTAARRFADAGGAVVRIRHRSGGPAADRRLALREGALHEVSS
jgi:putative ABC transport system ATP-binding protein